MSVRDKIGWSVVLALVVAWFAAPVAAEARVISWGWANLVFFGGIGVLAAVVVGMGFAAIWRAS